MGTGATGGGVSGAWNERMRLIRLRRKRERTTFREELKVIPRWLWWLMFALLVIAQIVAFLINTTGVANNGRMWPEGVEPGLAVLALAGAVTLVWSFVTLFVLLLGYVSRDAKRRGMNSTLWVLLCLILMPAYGFIGFIIYFLVREPLFYPCPRCAVSVGPRFNFCPNCKCDLHPSCPQCKREIAETDRYCPYCAYELRPASTEGQQVSVPG